MSGVELSGVTKSFGDSIVVDRLSLSIEAGELVVLLGPSGCGKSTILRMIAGLEAEDEGDIRIGGRRVTDLPPGRRGVAMVFQNYALYPHMTVRGNLAFGLQNAGVAAAEIARRIHVATESLEIAGLLERRPGQLSGGQRQRVAIARAIVKEPEVFLFDEPLSNLDAALRLRTRIELAELHRRLGVTMIYVTHDQVEAMTLASRIVVLNEGRVVQSGTPTEIYRRPATRFVATFVGSPTMNLLPAGISTSGACTRIEMPDGTALESTIAPCALAGSGPYLLGLRPEHVRIAGAGDRADTRASVRVVERLGERTLVHVALADGHRLVAEDAGLSSVMPGDTVALTIDGGAAHLFDADGRGHHGAAKPP